MKVDTMRKIDRWVGIPLCFFLSVAVGMKNLFGRAKRKEMRRVLFIELSEMGSAVLADPAMGFLKEKGKVELYFVIFKKNKPSLKLLATVDEENIFTIREGDFFVFTADTLRFLWWCRKKKIDTVIDLELFSRFTALLAILTGAARRVGFYGFHQEGLYRGSFLTHKVAYNPHLHMAKNFMALVYALLAEEDQTPFTKRPIPDEAIKLKKVSYGEGEKGKLKKKVAHHFPAYRPEFHKIILINPNASEMLIQRRWPLVHYVALIKKILAANDRILILLTGDPRERVEAEEIRKMVEHDRCVNFAGALTLEELPVLYSISEFMVTNDSGPAHFAAVTDMPTYVFFGPETPTLYRSLGKTTPIYAHFACSPCVSAYNHRKTACQDNKCLQSIGPEDVFTIIEEALERLNERR